MQVVAGSDSSPQSSDSDLPNVSVRKKTKMVCALQFFLEMPVQGPPPPPPPPPPKLCTLSSIDVTDIVYLAFDLGSIR